MKTITKYENKQEDPFYKVYDRGSTMREDADFYYLNAYVPFHEKDHVKVVVQKDKVTVAGKRSFSDKVEAEGKNLRSESYQSFNEEFLFGSPIISEGMTRVRNGEFVEYKIPKLKTYDSKA
ncbi:MAG: Hsp20 family protein [Pseudobdellovibrionaceae bacterium]